MKHTYQLQVCYGTLSDYNTVVYPYRCAIAGVSTSAQTTFNSSLPSSTFFSQGFRPVHAAAYMGDLDCLKMLGEAGADLTATSDDGYTALSAAFLNQNLTVAEIKPVIDYLLANADFGEKSRCDTSM